MENLIQVNNVIEAQATEVVEVAEISTKKVSLRQDFLKGFQIIATNKEQVCEVVGINAADFDKMVEYFDTQINKTKTTSSNGDYKPTEKASTILDILFSYEGEFKTGKEIAESSQGMLKANGVSGSIRGLVSNNLVEATNDSPKKYKITQLGVDYMNDQEK